MKRGQQEPLNLIIGLIPTLMVVMAFVFIFTSCTLGKTRVDVRTNIAYESLLDNFKACAAYHNTECYCPPVTLEPFPQGDYIQLVTYENGIYLELRKEDSEVIFRRDKLTSAELCTYDYQPQEKQTYGGYVKTGEPQWVRTQIQTLVVSKGFGSREASFYLENSTSLCLTTSRTVAPLQTKVRSCALSSDPASLANAAYFIHQRKLPYQYTRYTYSGSKEPTSQEEPRQKTSVLETLRLNEQLRSSFSLSLGKTYQSKLQPYTKSTPAISIDPLARPDMDSYLNYLSLGDGFFGDSAQLSKDLDPTSGRTLVILSTLYRQQDTLGKDTLTLYYLKDSSLSKLLAETLQKHLQALSGTSYKDEFRLSSSDDEYSKNLLDFTITVQPVDDIRAKELEFPIPPQFYEQRNVYPIVLIDFVDFRDAVALLDHHYYAFSQTLLLGTKEFQETSVTTKKTENILS